MGRPDEVAKGIKEGKRPSHIAVDLGISCSSVTQYMKTALGKSLITKIDVIQTIPRSARDAMNDIIAEQGKVSEFDLAAEIKKRGHQLNREDLRVFLELTDGTSAELYELIRRIEILLHGTIRQRFLEEFGVDWWRKGIPEIIRCECAAASERDSEPAIEPYCYTTFIQMREIYDKKWPILAKTLPKGLQKDKGAFLDSLTEVNRIRNAVMHPVKRIHITDEKIAFLRQLWSDLNAP